ncbi:siderophore-interacting protein [Williamsia sp. CHRR-6]|uniref:siderophore-interacting protein n=1 Tax=Williamsia sp. CHRR-6 TaxID=2835871 RepID=UPI001BDA66A5|nr:siderophore-interacting protein [Williamsia sp. CHRR-6]MBT0567459.1 siderophore-interacting protein [Williamsia sp. CHRR-6]
MLIVPAAVTAVTDLSPRLRRIVFDLPRSPEPAIPGGPDAAIGIGFSADPEVAATNGRNYTVRRMGPGPTEVTVDFVRHARGVATDWAHAAQIGDRVHVGYARSWYQPEASTEWQLLVADMTGLPALARILEGLSAAQQSSVTVIVEVLDAADLDYLAAPATVSMISSIGTGNGRAPSVLAQRAREFSHPPGRGYCWFAGEAAASREVRKHLRAHHGFDTAQFDIIGYWRRDSETWDRRYAAVADDLYAAYLAARQAGRSEKEAAEEFDLALERAGL